MRTLTSPDDTAVLLAVLLTRSGQTRARFSTKTLRLLARRKRLGRDSFVRYVTDSLADNHGWFMTPLSTGGYGAAKETAIAAGKTVTPRRLLTDEERHKLKRGKLSEDDWTAFYKDLPEEEPLEDE